MTLAYSVYSVHTHTHIDIYTVQLTVHRFFSASTFTWSKRYGAGGAWWYPKRTLWHVLSKPFSISSSHMCQNDSLEECTDSFLIECAWGGWVERWEAKCKQRNREMVALTGRWREMEGWRMRWKIGERAWTEVNDSVEERVMVWMEVRSAGRWWKEQKKGILKGKVSEVDDEENISCEMPGSEWV